MPVDKPLPSNSRSSAAIATGCGAVGGRGAGGARWKMLCVGRGSPGPPPAPAAAAPGGVLVSLARGREDGVGADPAAQLPNWPRCEVFLGKAVPSQPWWRGEEGDPCQDPFGNGALGCVCRPQALLVPSSCPRIIFFSLHLSSLVQSYSPGAVFGTSWRLTRTVLIPAPGCSCSGLGF